MIARDALRDVKRIAVGALACLLAGCATHALMPTPAVYTGPNAKPLFADASLESRQSELDLLFLTDRAPANGFGGTPYTAERSRSIAFGSTMIEFKDGKDLILGTTTELGRFPAIPYPLIEGPGGMRRAPAVIEAHTQAKRDLQAEIGRRLTIARRKEIVLFVHGYHVNFEKAALTMGELCHFLDASLSAASSRGRLAATAVSIWATTSTESRPSTPWKTS